MGSGASYRYAGGWLEARKCVTHAVADGNARASQAVWAGPFGHNLAVCLPECSGSLPPLGAAWICGPLRGVVVSRIIAVTCGIG